MSGFNRKDWEDLNVTREEVESITQALKKEEFRRLLSEYAEEITDPNNRKQYQEDIIKLEAERGVDCTFVNPEPGFVVKTSVDGKKKAFVNVCKNKAVGRPSSRPEIKNESRGLSWSIPLCQAPGREDFDKKRNRCVVYDVIFHPDTLHLAEKNPQFKKLVIDTALNAVEDSYGVTLDKKNYKIPKMGFKGVPFATVIRKKSKVQPDITDEDREFFEKIKCPFKPPNESAPVVRNFENKKPDTERYTIPKYVIKHRSDVDMQEFTFDKHAKMNAAIPKQLVIEVNLPLLSSTQTVTLDIMEKSLHLHCDKPARYKLDIQLPYSVNEETGNAKFDKERRLLIVTLPVIKAKMTMKDLMREDSGVESDFSPVGSISNNEYSSMGDGDITGGDRNIVYKGEEQVDVIQADFEVSAEEGDVETEHRTSGDVEEFLEPDKHYTLPGFSCNIDEDRICFVLNVKNVDPDRVMKRLVHSSACHIKFVSIGAGFFPVNYAFFVDFKDECRIRDVACEAWDNNVTVSIEFERSDGEDDGRISRYYVGVDEESVTQHVLTSPLELRRRMESVLARGTTLAGIDEDDDEEDDDEARPSVTVESATVDEVVLNVEPEREDSLESSPCGSSEMTPVPEEKCRTLSESGVDEIVVPGPVRKSILKKRICRSLSESNADDYAIGGVIDKTVSDGSDLCIQEEHEGPYIKKTVRFSEKIRQQLFRVNSCILARKNKNKKKSRNKKRAQERKLSESENSEVEDRERDKKTKKPKTPQRNQGKTNNNTTAAAVTTSSGTNNSSHSTRSSNSRNSNTPLIQDISNSRDRPNKGKGKESSGRKDAPGATDRDPGACTVPGPETDATSHKKQGLKKDDKIFEFKSDLIFDLEV